MKSYPMLGELTMGSRPFASEVEIAAEIYERIRTELAEGDPDLWAIAEAETEDFHSRMKWLARKIITADEEAAGVEHIRKERDKTLKARQEHWERQSQKGRAILLYALQRLGLDAGKLQTADFTAFVSHPKHGPVEVPDPMAVPDEFSHIVKTPNKVKIKELLEGGMLPNWAHLGEAKPRLTIRVK